MSTNKLYYLLGVLTTTLSVVAYMEIVETETHIKTKTESVVRMVNVPFAPSDYELLADWIKTSLNK